MDLAEIILRVREHYLARYRQSIAAYRVRFQPGGPEVLVEVDRPFPAPYRFYRFDLASGAVDPPNWTEVNPDSHLEFSVFHLDHGGIDLVINPIVWNGVQFRVEPPIRDDKSLQEWALRWIDVEERAESDEDGLGAYIHSITPPTSDSVSTEISIDFGSSPLECFYELLEILRIAGAERVEIHSRTVLGDAVAA